MAKPHTNFVTYWHAYQAEPPEESPYETFEDFLWVGVQQAREWFNDAGRVAGEAIEQWEDDWREEATLPDRDTFFRRSEVHPVCTAFVAWHAAAAVHEPSPRPGE